MAAFDRGAGQSASRQPSLSVSPTARVPTSKLVLNENYLILNYINV
jgi:hypothetical protein